MEDIIQHITKSDSYNLVRLEDWNKETDDTNDNEPAATARMVKSKTRRPTVTTPSKEAEDRVNSIMESLRLGERTKATR